MKVRSRIRRVTDGFWFVPATCVLLAIAAGLGLVYVDRHLLHSDQALLFGGGPDGARALLSAITSSMISFTALVFSITIVVLQLTSSQYSPRALRQFLGDRWTQWTLGVFAATFVYAMTVLRTVRSKSTGGEFVPHLAATVSFLFVLLSVAMFVYYIHHIANSIRASSIVNAIAEQTRHVLDRRYPPDATYDPRGDVPESAPSQAAPAPRPGVVTGLDTAKLCRIASEHDVVLEVLVPVGSFVPEGAPILAVHGTADEAVCRSATRHVQLGPDRTMTDDPLFGFRQLADIALRALSPGVNDPTTAIEALQQAHDLLRRVAERELPPGQLRDESGDLRVVMPESDIGDFLDVALAEVTAAAAELPRVTEAVRRIVSDVAAVARPEHLPAVLAAAPAAVAR